MNNSRNLQGSGLASLLMGALQGGMPAASQTRRAAQDGAMDPLQLLGAMGNLGGSDGFREMLNPSRRSRAPQPANPLGGLLGALFGGSRRAHSGNAQLGTGMMAVGALALQFLQRWMAQSKAPQPQATTQAPRGGVQIPATYGPQGTAQTGAATGGIHTGWPQSPSATSQQTQPQWEDATPQGQVAAPAGPDATLMLLLEAMINAAKADGHIDAEERQYIHNALVAFLPAEAVDQAIAPLLNTPADPVALAARVQDIEQAKDVYRLSCAAIDIDTPEERAYLEALGNALYLPPDLRTTLETEAQNLQSSVQQV